MAIFLIDVNLPYYFSIWNSPDYIHQVDINDSWTDSQIWEYAKEKRLTIITKDTDFTNRILLTDPPPKVIHIRIGNFKLKEFHTLLTKIWTDVLKLNNEYKLVTVYPDRIEGIKSNPA
jgi:predicted nuclease of predicted toxin-antitoxin system